MDADVWEDPTKVENFVPSVLNGLSNPGSIVSMLTRGCTLIPPLQYSLHYLCLREFKESAMTFPKREARQHTTHRVTQGPPIVAWVLRTRLKVKQAPRGAIESEITKEVCYTTKGLSKSGDSF